MNEERAAQDIVERITPHASGHYKGFPFWHAPHLKQMFLAGVEWERNRQPQEDNAESNGGGMPQESQ